jgi:hypothetical protein
VGPVMALRDRVPGRYNMTDDSRVTTAVSADSGDLERDVILCGFSILTMLWTVCLVRGFFKCCLGLWHGWLS